MKTTYLLATVVATILAQAPANSATLLDGATVRMEHRFPNQATPDFSADYTVGTSAPANYFGISDASATDTTFTVRSFCGQGCTWTAPVAFNGWVMSDLYNQVAAFTSVTLASTSYAGFDAGRVSFDADNVYIDLQGLDANGFVTVAINGAVPEPASWAMMIGGFGLLGAAARRRTSATVAYA